MPTLRASILSAALLAATTLAAAAQTVPTLNVEPTCRDVPAEGSAFKRDAAACMKAENDARAELVKQWSAFTPTDRSLCTQTATMGGTASYVQLLTCLELRRDVRTLPQDELTRLGKPE